VLDPYRLAISFIALIHTVCCLKTYLHKTMQMGFVFCLRMFQDKCNRDCNRDYLHRNQLHLCCNRPMSGRVRVCIWKEAKNRKIIDEKGSDKQKKQDS